MAMSDDQREVADLAARILGGILAGELSKNQFGMNDIRPYHVQGSVNMALAIVEQVQQRVPAGDDGDR